MKREAEQRLEQRCAHCREPLPKTKEEAHQNLMKRVEANDPEAMCQMGKKCNDEEDHNGAFEYWSKAAALEDVTAHYHLSLLYHDGNGVEMDKKKEIYHLEEAAIGGHPGARYNLGNHEGRNGRHERAARHFTIAANLGLDDALEEVKKGFTKGFVSKENFEAALRGHQATVDATKSEQREEGYAFYKSVGLDCVGKDWSTNVHSS